MSNPVARVGLYLDHQIFREGNISRASICESFLWVPDA